MTLLTKLLQTDKTPEQVAQILLETLPAYDNALKDLETKIEIKGKKLEHANRENPGYQQYYDERRVELSVVVKWFEIQIERVRGKLFKKFTENYNRELSDRAKEQYINNEPAYLMWYEMYLEVKELHDKYDSAKEAFKSRGYALNNITRIRVASLEDIYV